MTLLHRITLCCVLISLAPLAVQAAEPGFTPLFDGKTLNGWTIDCLPRTRNSQPRRGRLTRGTLLADTMGHEDHFYILLATDKEYGDFVLCGCGCRSIADVTGNSGIQIRSRYNAETGWMEGPQIDINPPNPAGHDRQALERRPGRAPLALQRAGQGPEVLLCRRRRRLERHGDHGQRDEDHSVLNGVTVVDYDGSGVLDDELHKHHVGTKGVIGLQIHSHELKLRSRNPDQGVVRDRFALDG